MSVGVENVAIEGFLEQSTKKLKIIITDTTIDCYIDQEKLDIETLKQSYNNLPFRLVGIQVRKRKLSSAKNSQPSEIAKFSSPDEQLTPTPQPPEPKLQRTKNLPSYRKTLNMEYQREKLTQQQNNQTTQAKPRHTKSAPTRPVRQH